MFAAPRLHSRLPKHPLRFAAQHQYRRMATSPVALTKEYIQNAFKSLEEIEDVAKRSEFFKKYMVEDVEWNITGSGHDLVGTRYNLADHNAVTFAKLGQNLVKPIKFVVRSIILEPDTRWACVETQGFATRKNGKPYNNDYIWLTRWNDDGKIYYVRSYFDTKLSQEALHDDDP